MAEALEPAGRARQLRELFEALTASGIDLQGADPSAVLGMMIWRTRKRLANIKATDIGSLTGPMTLRAIDLVTALTGRGRHLFWVVA